MTQNHDIWEEVVTFTEDGKEYLKKIPFSITLGRMCNFSVSLVQYLVICFGFKKIIKFRGVF